MKNVPHETMPVLGCPAPVCLCVVAWSELERFKNGYMHPACGRVYSFDLPPVEADPVYIAKRKEERAKKKLERATALRVGGVSQRPEKR